MHADYDTDADALELVLRKVDRFDGSDEVDDYFCQEELLATAQAALAAPDHLVEVSIGKSLVA